METRDIKVNLECTIIQKIPTSILTDTVTIQIKRNSDGYFWNFTTEAWQVASSTGNMTFSFQEFWTATFTPTTNDAYHLVNIVFDSTAYSQVLHSITDNFFFVESALSAFTTLANVKEFFKITGTGMDALITNLIIRITKEIQNFCERKLFSDTYTQYYDGSGYQTLMVDEYPVTAITSIHDDDDHVYGTDTLIDSGDYIFNSGSKNALSGLIKMDGSYFSRGTENIKIVYTAGYTTVPGDLEEACILMVGADRLFHDLIFNAPVAQGENSESKDLGGMRKRAKDILQTYKRVR
jgi:hypothetical protein